MGQEDSEGLPKPGETIAGKYVVERVIGAGGMGAVVAARHAQLGHEVAIKFLRGDYLVFDAAVARFLREARAAVAIKSEHVARVLDVGELDTGAPYMIMEYLQGRDLEAVLEERGTLPVLEAIDYVLQACEALAEAHALALVHRDLKPANLFLAQRPDGSPLLKVLDFGIAKALDEVRGGTKPSLTTTGSALGTPMYMSPEQVRDAKNVDPRTDIWGLGAVLYELLCGEPPFWADTVPALCAMIVADPAPNVRDVRADVPEDLGQVIARCLAKKVEDRYQTVAELALALAPHAPPAALVSVERVVRIVAGPLSAEESGRWVVRESFVNTVASSPGLPVPNRGAQASTSAGVTATPAPAELTSTAGAWQTGSRSTRPSRIAAGAVLAIALVGGALWLATGSSADSPEAPSVPAAGDDPTLAPPPAASAATVAAASTDARATAPLTAASAAASASAATSATAPIPKQPSAPTAPRPPPAATAAPPPPNTGGTPVDPLLDRK